MSAPPLSGPGSGGSFGKERERPRDDSQLFGEIFIFIKVNRNVHFWAKNYLFFVNAVVGTGTYLLD